MKRTFRGTNCVRVSEAMLLTEGARHPGWQRAGRLPCVKTGIAVSRKAPSGRELSSEARLREYGDRDGSMQEGSLV